MTSHRAVKPNTATPAKGSACAVIVPAPEAPRVWGLTPSERLRRALPRAGIRHVPSEGAAWPAQGSVVLLRGDVVYDDAILDGLAAKPGVLVAREGADGPLALAAHVEAGDAQVAFDWLRGLGQPPRVGTVVAPEDMGESYRGWLRKREAPFCLPVTRDNVREVERRLYAGAYKGVTDLVTKYLWPMPALWATRACARMGLTPNAVTFAGAVLVVLAFWLFWNGALGWGLLAAWTMTFLDTVDGKLARVTLTSSRLGNLLDHGLDLVHPPFWYAAWGVGLAGTAAALPPGWLAPTLWAIIVGYVVGRLCEGYFLYRFGVEIHVWRRFDSAFRLITARRNPNLLLLTLGWLTGRPDQGLLAVAIWTVASDLVHLLQIAQAERARARGAPVGSWLRMAT